MHNRKTVIEGVDVFVEVVEAQSFTRAAKRLGRPVTTVSAQIARLEERLGVTLIRRTTRKLHVTDAGKRYYAHCARVMAELGEADNELAAASSEPSGLLRITSTADVAHVLLVPHIDRFLKTYPKATVELIVSRIRLDLIEERIDLAVRAGPLGDSSLTARKFLSSRLALRAAPAYVERNGAPLEAADLADHTTISLASRSKRLLLRSSNGGGEMEFTGRLAIDDFGAIRSAIVSGVGVGMLPDFAGEELMRQGRLVPVMPEFGSDPLTLYLVYPAQKFAPQTVRAFIALATGAETSAKPAHPAARPGLRTGNRVAT